MPSLADALGDEPPATVSALPDDVLARLAEHIEEARRRQSATMDSAVTAALNGVPPPFRGMVRKALLG